LSGLRKMHSLLKSCLHPYSAMESCSLIPVQESVSLSLCGVLCVRVHVGKLLPADTLVQVVCDLNYGMALNENKHVYIGIALLSALIHLLFLTAYGMCCVCRSASCC